MKIIPELIIRFKLRFQRRFLVKKKAESVEKLSAQLLTNTGVRYF